MLRKGILVMLLIIVNGFLIAQPVKKNPTKAIVYSLFPGGGQIYNESYIKAGAVIGIQSFLIASAVHNNSKVQDWKDKINAETDPFLLESYKNSQKNYREKHTRDFWLMGFTLAFSTLDAYIDANLSNFKAEKENIHLRFEDKTLFVEYHF